MDIRHHFAKTIEATGNPNAPFILEGVYTNLNRLGPLLATLGDSDNVKDIGNKIMDTIADGDESKLDEISASPDFILTLSGMLSVSLIKWVQSLSK